MGIKLDTEEFNVTASRGSYTYYTVVCKKKKNDGNPVNRVNEKGYELLVLVSSNIITLFVIWAKQTRKH